jgi:RNA 2',3'-cyclic 3'-phosphodiesterase
MAERTYNKPQGAPVRTFIAIDLEPDLKEAVITLVESLKRTRADVRWAGPSGLHLTLKFLGEVGADAVPKVTSALERIAGPHRPFPLVLEGTGRFPQGRAPRVLWVGVRPQPALLSLQEGLERELEAEGFPRESRAFHPHLTLGRVKGPSFVREALAELEKNGSAVFGEMEVRRITLFESQLRPDGARYRVVSEHTLS